MDDCDDFDSLPGKFINDAIAVYEALAQIGVLKLGHHAAKPGLFGNGITNREYFFYNPLSVKSRVAAYERGDGLYVVQCFL